MKHIGKFVLLIGAIFGYMYFTLSPDLQFIRDSFWYTLAYYIVINSIIIYVMFKKSLKTSFPTKIALSLIILLTILTFIEFPYKQRLLLIFISGFIVVITTIIVYYNKYIHKEPKRQFELYPMMIGVFFMLSCASIVNRFDYINGANSLWLYSAIASGIITLLSVLLVLKYKDRIHERQNHIFIPILTFMISLTFIGLTSLFLNYVLDYTEPLFNEGVIIDMDISSGYRQMTSYDLTISLDDDEIIVGVSQLTYFQLEVGDEVKVVFYNGAFGIGYYYYEPWIILE